MPPSLLVYATIIDATTILARILEPKDLALYLPASRTVDRKARALDTNGPTGRDLHIIVFPIPPLAFPRVRILGIDKIFHGTIQIELAAIDHTSARGTLLGIQLVRALAPQGLDRGITHPDQILFRLFPDIWYFPKLTHKQNPKSCIIDIRPTSSPSRAAKPATIREKEKAFHLLTNVRNIPRKAEREKYADRITEELDRIADKLKEDAMMLLTENF